MSFGRTVVLSVAVGCACSAPALADQPSKQIDNVGFAPAGRATGITNIVTGRTVVPGARPAPRGTPIIGFDNMTCAPCTTGLNVAYVQPGSYDGSNTSAQASIFGLGDGAAGSSLRAPTNAQFTLPTDVVWNDYTGDQAVWPGGADASAIATEFHIVTARSNTGGVDRIDTYNVLFFSADGLEFIGGFQFTVNTTAGQTIYQEVAIDLADFDPPLSIPRDGLIMVDCPGPAAGTPAVGVGLAFAGGDLANTHFPTPASQVAVGATDAEFWAFANHTLGDPNFDGQPGLSYLDVLNSTPLVNWGFTSALPGGALGTRTLAHDFPVQIMVSGAPASGACSIAGLGCLVLSAADCEIQGGVYSGDGTNCPTGACRVNNPAPACTVTTELDCVALGGVYQGNGSSCCACDWNHDAALNSQDFFDFLGCFFAPPCNADFNGDSVSNSQDFFDFLACFFAPPSGC